MIPADPPPAPEAPTSGDTGDHPAATPGAGRSGRPWRLGVAAVLAGLIAAAGAWLLGETRLVQVTPAISQYNMMGRLIRDATAETRQVAAIQTTARVYGVFGGLLGLLLGLAGGWARGRSRAAMIAAAVGLLAGIAAGAVAPIAVLPPYHRLIVGRGGGLVPALLMHCGLWTALGAAAGLAAGIGLADLRRLARAALGGAIGAVLGAVAFDVLAAIAFPLGGTDRPIPGTWGARLLAFLLLGVSIAAGAALGGRGPDAAKPVGTPAEQGVD
jgi:hypothetical protein